MTVVIVGGGVAGAATALALQRAGIAAEIYEAHESGGEDAGAFLTVMGNGMAAIDRIGATPAIEAVSYPARAVSLWDAQGQHLGRRPIQGAARSMTRAALYRALQELAVERGIPVHHGKRMTGARTGADGVEVSFADGSTATGDTLVGADGIHSRTRRLIDPDAPEPRYSGQHVVYGYAQGNPAGVTTDEYHMIRGSRAFFGFTAPSGDNRTWWFARINADQQTADNPLPKDRPDNDPHDERRNPDRYGQDRPGENRPADERPDAHQPGGNRSDDERPGGDRRDDEWPGGDRRDDEWPGGDRRDDERPGGDRRGGGRWRELALAMFRDDATPAAAIVAATGGDVVGGDSFDIPTTPRWHNARMVLVGDAAHAATPAAAQGASMALEDAVALAEALRGHDEPAKAFAVYENGRRAQTEETVAASARLIKGG